MSVETSHTGPCVRIHVCDAGELGESTIVLFIFEEVVHTRHLLVDVHIALLRDRSRGRLPRGLDIRVRLRTHGGRIRRCYPSSRHPITTSLLTCRQPWLLALLRYLKV